MKAVLGQEGETGKLARRLNYKGQIALALVAVLALAVAISLFFSVRDYVRELGVAQQDQAQWRATQLEVEFLKLSAAVSAAERVGDTPNLEHLRERFDVFYSRVPLIPQETLSPDALPLLIQLRQALDDLIPLIDASDATLAGGLEQIKATIREHEQSPRIIALGSIRGVAEARGQERERIALLLEVMLGAIVATTLILVLAIIFLIRRTIMLHQASILTKERQQQLEATLNGSLDAIVVTDSHGAVLGFNSAAENMFGHTADDILGRSSLELLVPQPLRAEIAANLQLYLETGQTTMLDRGRQEMVMLRADGTEFPALFTSSTAKTHNEPIFISYIRDVTLEKLHETEILQARDSAVQAFRERSRYFAMMSHEMRTPLNGVLSALYLLEESSLNDEQLDYVKTALFSGDVLMSHINDVLAIERSESEEEFAKTSCDVGSLCSNIINMMQAHATAMDVVLDLQTKGLDGRLLMTVPRALQQILTNLMSNAIKFSPKGAVSLFVQYVPSSKESNEGILHFEVSDTGIGIAPQDQDRIFEDFVSLDSRYERRTGGTGLGLGIVRRFIQRMNGTVRCESSLGEGTAFIVELPMQESFRTLPKGDNPRARASLETASKRILVVDDNNINRDLLRRMLEMFGHEVALADGGQAAIDVTATQSFELILMDISMPNISGTQATRVIRETPGPNKATPIVAFTAHALPQEQEAFREAGMNGFLLKPVNREALRDCLTKDYQARAISTSIRGEDLGNPHALLNEEQVSDLEEFLAPDQLQERHAAFCLDAESQIQALEVARDQGDTQLMQTTAHTLSGMCGMMGAYRMQLLSREIEQACNTGRVSHAETLLADVPAAFAATREAWKKRVT